MSDKIKEPEEEIEEGMPASNQKRLMLDVMALADTRGEHLSTIIEEYDEDPGAFDLEVKEVEFLKEQLPFLENLEITLSRTKGIYIEKHITRQAMKLVDMFPDEPEPEPKSVIQEDMMPGMG